MARVAYHRNNRAEKIWLAFLLGGIAGQVGVFWLFSVAGLTKNHGALAFFLSVLLLPAALLVALGITSRLNRERFDTLATRLQGLGFRMTQKPGEAERAAFAAPIAQFMPFLGLKTDAVGIQWFAEEQSALGKNALIFEHEFVTGVGKQRMSTTNTIVARPAGHRDVREMGLNSSAWFSMARQALMRRTPQNDALRAREFADIVKTWSIEGDAGMATRFLVPDARSALQRSPKHEAWFMGAAWVCCYYKGTFDAENMERFLAHSREVLAAGR
jgi:hypothetical protein